MPKKILLVDDVELFLEMEKDFFRRENFTLLVARSGKEALSAMRGQRPDLVFIDLYMPEGNGDEAVRQAKGDPELRAIPIVMVTNSKIPEDLDRCRRAGCDEILLKPINREQFLSTAHRLLRLPQWTGLRSRMRLTVRFGPDPQNLQKTYSPNVSVGGMFLETARLLPLNTTLALEFELPGAARLISCRGRVAWINPPGMPTNRDLPPGIGVEFQDLGPVDLNLLRRHVENTALFPLR